jgi:hypothetical protein
MVKTDDFSRTPFQVQSVSHFPINQTICRTGVQDELQTVQISDLSIDDYEKARNQLEGHCWINGWFA